MEITKNEKIRNYVMKMISHEMGNKLIYPYGREFWIIDEDTLEWFVQIECNGTVWFNQKIFNDLLRIFSFENHENKFFIKHWIEECLGFRVSCLSRKNTNYKYIIGDMLKDKSKKWSLKNRYGFSYQIVKRYISIRESSTNKNVRVFDYSIPTIYHL